MKAFKEPIEKKKSGKLAIVPVKREEQTVISIVDANFISLGKRMNSTEEGNLGSAPSVSHLIPELRYACENLRKQKTT